MKRWTPLTTADRSPSGKRAHLEGRVQVRADLVVGCDGRHAATREAAQLEVLEYGVPIDVLWFRISRHSTDPDQLFGNVNYGKVLILINRGDYFQSVSSSGRAP